MQTEVDSKHKEIEYIRKLIRINNIDELKDNAIEALNQIEIRGIVAEKAMGSPPQYMRIAGKMILILKLGEKKNYTWRNVQRCHGTPKRFIDELIDFDMDNIEDWKID